ncbi:uncharacterized protein C1orf87 isoform X1 [Seriola aureovittata]|uniref:uncharacterized protein C1orf87 isoform X1 n=1 Tax=Seriola aureovittata TaxID=2871759 RepID=UPI0024BE5AC3|nr:uncharacterized protein C1orf87 isoform X1 [Seriola aureovittata]
MLRRLRSLRKSITCIMAQKNTSGRNTVPRLVVKIVGGKQVKQFIEEPQEDTSEREAENPPVEAPDEPDVSRSHQQLHNRVDSALWAVINQVPDRLCVTAPSGDHSRSYIHPKTRQHVTEHRAAEPPETTEQRGESEPRDKWELSSAVREELRDWQLSSLRSTEDEVAALDASLSGTVNRSEITHLFLKNDVPLKLPTFSLLLQIFSDKDDPVQIYYRNLLQFIKTSAFPDDLPAAAAASFGAAEGRS